MFVREQTGGETRAARTQSRRRSVPWPAGFARGTLPSSVTGSHFRVSPEGNDRLAAVAAYGTKGIAQPTIPARDTLEEGEQCRDPERGAHLSDTRAV